MGNSFLEIVKQNKKALICLAFLAVLVYANGLPGDFLSDDKMILTTDLGNFSQVFSQPRLFLRAFFYFAIYVVFGKNPLFFRLLNLSFHIVSTLSIYLIVNLLKGKKQAWAASLIFAVHPILVESVTWISGGGYAQYSAFFLISLLFYILSNNNKKYYWLSLLFFLMSLFSAEKSFILGAMFFVYQICFENVKKVWKKAVPYLSLSLIGGIYYLSRLGERAKLLQVGTYNPVKTTGIPLSYFFQNIATALTKYLELIFWPQHLTLYQSEAYTSRFAVTLSLIVLISIAIALIYGFFKNKNLFFGLSLFLVSLAPFLTPFGISWWVAERYAYLASSGIIFIIVSFLGHVETNRPKLKRFFLGLLIVAVACLSIRTIVRNHDWLNEDNLWPATARESPSDPKTHNNMGDYYGRHKNLEMALKEFQKAIELNPKYADAFHNLANTYLDMGKTDLAIENYKKAFELNPNLWQSAQNLGIIYFQEKDFNQAASYLEKAVELNPDDALLHFDLGVVYREQGEKEKSALEFQKAAQLDPSIEEFLQKQPTP